MHPDELIYDEDPASNTFGKVHVMTPDGHLVLLGGSHPDPITGRAPLPELRPGFRFATKADLAVVHAKALEISNAPKE